MVKFHWSEDVFNILYYTHSVQHYIQLNLTSIHFAATKIKIIFCQKNQIFQTFRQLEYGLWPIAMLKQSTKNNENILFIVMLCFASKREYLLRPEN